MGEWRPTKHGSRQPTILGLFGSANVMHPVGARRYSGTTATTQSVLSRSRSNLRLKEATLQGHSLVPKGIFVHGCGTWAAPDRHLALEERRFTILVAKAAFRLEDNYNNSRWPNGRVIIRANNCNEMSLLCAVGHFSFAKNKAFAALFV